MQVSVGFGPFLSQMHYRSNIIAVPHSSEAFAITFDDEFVFGEYLRIDLYGCHEIWPTNSLYYIGLQSVRCLGVPLCPPLVSEFQDVGLNNFATIASRLLPSRPYRQCEISIETAWPMNTREAVLRQLLNCANAGDFGTVCEIIPRYEAHSWLRTPSTLTWFINHPRNLDHQFEKEYVLSLRNNSEQFTVFEAWMFVRAFGAQVVQMFDDFRACITITEEYGDILLEEGLRDLAMKVYEQRFVTEKVYFYKDI